MMKITSDGEQNFINNCICKIQKRLDGRSLLSGRVIEIIFDKDWGCCTASLGNTRVLSQVSAELTNPKLSTPTEGDLHINLEVSQMSAPDAKPRSSDETVESQRSLERCIRDSKCIDLESLCVVAGSKVWRVRVDVHALNDDGNLIECASVAAISALAHFRRPDVTVVGTEVTVHSLVDREPIPLSLHHMPIVVCLGLFQQGERVIVDPTELEERVADGCYVIGMNAHQEICFIHRRGALVLKEDIIQKCQELAVLRAQTITQTIRKAIDDDAYKRATKSPIGFVHMLQSATILGSNHPIHDFDLDSITKQQETSTINETVEIDEGDIENESKVVSQPHLLLDVSSAHSRAMGILNEQESAVFEGGKSKWGIDDSDISSEEDNKMEEEEENKMEAEDSKSLKIEKNDSSEEEIAYVDGDQVDMKCKRVRGWYNKNLFD